MHCDQAITACVICTILFPLNLDVDCGQLSDPANGSVNAPYTGFDEQATYSCNVGYELKGPMTHVCQANGEWSGNETTCEGKVNFSNCTQATARNYEILNCVHCIHGYVDIDVVNCLRTSQSMKTAIPVSGCENFLVCYIANFVTSKV